MKRLPDLAIGSYEAACVLGVHWTTPGRMAQKGLLTTRTLRSPIKNDTDREFVVYSLHECEADFREYEDKVLGRGGKSDRRPRGFVDERPAMLKYLATVEPILFGDAVSTGDAGEVVGTHWTFCARLATAGKIRGRVLRNSRHQKSRLWIFSRQSCEANAAVAFRQQEAGTKKGRPRRKRPA